MTLIWTYIQAQIIPECKTFCKEPEKLNENMSFTIYTSHLIQVYAFKFSAPFFISSSGIHVMFVILP